MMNNDNETALNVSPRPEESIIDIINELPELDPVTTYPERRKGYSKKTIAIFMICYGIAILLLSFNISTSTHLVAVQRGKEDNQRRDIINVTTCHVDELSNTITINCRTRDKVFSLGNQFDFRVCD